MEEKALQRNCIEKIKAITVADPIQAYDMASSVGKVTREAKVRPTGRKYLEKFLNDLKKDIEEKEVFEAFAIWVHQMIRHRPFSDANRRVIFECLQGVLRLCGYEIVATEEEYIEIGSKLRRMSVSEIHSLIRERARSMDLSLLK
jgi:prophage maintenance system killer protein